MSLCMIHGRKDSVLVFHYYCQEGVKTNPLVCARAILYSNVELIFFYRHYTQEQSILPQQLQ